MLPHRRPSKSGLRASPAGEGPPAGSLPPVRAAGGLPVPACMGAAVPLRCGTLPVPAAAGQLLSVLPLVHGLFHPDGVLLRICHPSAPRRRHRAAARPGDGPAGGLAGRSPAWPDDPGAGLQRRVQESDHFAGVLGVYPGIPLPQRPGRRAAGMEDAGHFRGVPSVHQ